jgi:predicted nucleic acid-binding protein
MVIAAHQELTRQWWGERSDKYEILVSELVRQEASQGDQQAASERMVVLNSLFVLQVSDESLSLAELLVDKGPIPQQASADALHIAMAALNGIDYLLTWNCKHLANATHRHRLESMIEDAGYACPIICTPEELMED